VHARLQVSVQNGYDLLNHG